MYSYCISLVAKFTIMITAIMYKTCFVKCKERLIIRVIVWWSFVMPLLHYYSSK